VVVRYISPLQVAAFVALQSEDARGGETRAAMSSPVHPPVHPRGELKVVKRLPARYDEELQDLKKLLADGLLTEEFYVAEVKYVLVQDTRPAIAHGKKRTVAPRGTTHVVARLGDGCGGAGKRAAVSLQCSRASKLPRV